MSQVGKPRKSMSYCSTCSIFVFNGGQMARLILTDYLLYSFVIVGWIWRFQFECRLSANYLVNNLCDGPGVIRP